MLAGTDPGHSLVLVRLSFRRLSTPVGLADPSGEDGLDDEDEELGSEPATCMGDAFAGRGSSGNTICDQARGSSEKLERSRALKLAQDSRLAPPPCWAYLTLVVHLALAQLMHSARTQVSAGFATRCLGWGKVLLPKTPGSSRGTLTRFFSSTQGLAFRRMDRVVHTPCALIRTCMSLLVVLVKNTARCHLRSPLAFPRLKPQTGSPEHA